MSEKNIEKAAFSGRYVEFEVFSYDEFTDSFRVTQTEESVEAGVYDVDDFNIQAEAMGNMLGFGEPDEFLGKKFLIVPL